MIANEDKALMLDYLQQRREGKLTPYRYRRLMALLLSHGEALLVAHTEGVKLSRDLVSESEVGRWGKQQPVASQAVHEAAARLGAAMGAAIADGWAPEVRGAGAR